MGLVYGCQESAVFCAALLGKCNILPTFAPQLVVRTPLRLKLLKPCANGQQVKEFLVLLVID